MSDKALTLVTVALLVVPWAVLLLVGILRGYSISLTRHAPKHRDDDD